MYEKQLDSGKGTLLHLYDDVIQQEVGIELERFLVTYYFDQQKKRSCLIAVN